MKKIVITLLILISPIVLFSQNMENENKDVELSNFFDPNFPEQSKTRDHSDAILEYIESDQYYPISIIRERMYAEDVKLQVDDEFDEEFKNWYLMHPFFPQPFDTGNPAKDKRVFLKARAMWIQYNPEAYEILCEMIRSDEYLRREFAFVVEL